MDLRLTCVDIRTTAREMAVSGHSYQPLLLEEAPNEDAT